MHHLASSFLQEAAFPQALHPIDFGYSFFLQAAATTIPA